MMISVLDQQAIYFTTIVHMEVVLIADTDELQFSICFSDKGNFHSFSTIFQFDAK